MILTLLCVTLFASASVGVVYKVTLTPIAEAKAAKLTAAIAQVLPEFDNNIEESRQTETVDGSQVTIYTATKGGEPVGYAVETFSNNGFAGTIKLMVGFLTDGTINRVETLEQNETPGLGDKIERKKSGFSVQFDGKNPASFKLAVKKDGGDVDAITASTISSRAFSDAVDRAYKIFLTKKEGVNND